MEFILCFAQVAELAGTLSYKFIPEIVRSLLSMADYYHVEMYLFKSPKEFLHVEGGVTLVPCMFSVLNRYWWLLLFSFFHTKQSRMIYQYYWKKNPYTCTLWEKFLKMKVKHWRIFFSNTKNRSNVHVVFSARKY